MTKTQTENLPAIVSADPVGAMLARKYSFLVPRVDPLEFQSGPDLSEEELDAQLVAALSNEGYTNVQEAYRAVTGVYGLKVFADKTALAETGEPFYVERIVQRVKGGYLKGDDWAMHIVIAATGEGQTLTLESNPGRDRFMYLLAYAMSKHPEQKPLSTIARFDKKDGTHFFIMQPAHVERNNAQVVGARLAGDDFIDAEHRAI